jgi:hypothetical protein
VNLKRFSPEIILTNIKIINKQHFHIIACFLTLGEKCDIPDIHLKHQWTYTGLQVLNHSW